MSRRAAPSQALVTRYIKAALAAGLKAGEFDVRAVGDEVTILTHPAGSPLPSPDQDKDTWSGAMAKWRRSA